jgi:hypothetical protein
MVEPWVRAAVLPRTSPKQWYNGTGIQSLSLGVNLIRSPDKKPLFKRLQWVSVAPFGKPVVPLLFD